MASSIAQQWQEFLTLTYAGGVGMSHEQRRELRLNFYSGFFAAIHVLAQIGQELRDSTDEATQTSMVKAYCDEYRAFSEAYLQERRGERP